MTTLWWNTMLYLKLFFLLSRGTWFALDMVLLHVPQFVCNACIVCNVQQPQPPDPHHVCPSNMFYSSTFAFKNVCFGAIVRHFLSSTLQCLLISLYTFYLWNLKLWHMFVWRLKCLWKCLEVRRKHALFSLLLLSCLVLSHLLSLILTLRPAVTQQLLQRHSEGQMPACCHAKLLYLQNGNMTFRRMNSSFRQCLKAFIVQGFMIKCTDYLCPRLYVELKQQCNHQVEKNTSCFFR